MEINKIKRSLLVLFFSFLAIGAQAQLEQAVKKIFAGDTITGGHVPLKRDSDSIHLVNMQKSLEEARLNEAKGEYEEGNGADETPDGYRRLRKICTATTAYRLPAAVHKRNTGSGGR